MNGNGRLLTAQPSRKRLSLDELEDYNTSVKRFKRHSVSCHAEARKTNYKHSKSLAPFNTKFLNPAPVPKEEYLRNTISQVSDSNNSVCLLKQVADSCLQRFVELGIKYPLKAWSVSGNNLKYKLKKHYGIWRYIPFSHEEKFQYYNKILSPKLTDLHKDIHALGELDVKQKNRLLAVSVCKIVREEKLGTCIDMCNVVLGDLFNQENKNYVPFLVNIVGNQIDDQKGIVISNHVMVALVAKDGYKNFYENAYNECIKNEEQDIFRLPWALSKHKAVIIDPLFRTIFAADSSTWSQKLTSILNQLELSRVDTADIYFTFYE